MHVYAYMRPSEQHVQFVVQTTQIIDTVIMYFVIIRLGKILHSTNMLNRVLESGRQNV